MHARGWAIGCEPVGPERTADVLMRSPRGARGIGLPGTSRRATLPRDDGACTGGAAYSAALCDFIIQVEKTAHVFITGPAVIKEVTNEVVSFEELGGAKVHSTRSGVVHLTASDDRECLDSIKRLLDFLPQNNREKPSLRECSDPVDIDAHTGRFSSARIPSW